MIRRSTRATETGGTVPLHFPTNLNLFPNVFLKMKFTGRTLEERKRGVFKTIYLPLPESEFFQKQFQLNYSTDDLGLSGEFAKRNIGSILDGIKKTGSSLSDLNTDKAFGQIADTLYDDILSLSGVGGAIKTALERQMMGGGGSNAVRAATQSLGYGAAPNSTQVFNGLNIRDTVILSWNLSPKNYEDGKAIENIYKEILKLSLPYLKEEHLTKTVNKYGGFLAQEDFISNQEQSIPLSMRRAIRRVDGVPTELEAGDVFSSTSGMREKLVNAQQYYSTTFELPYRLEIAVMKMKITELNSGGRGFAENSQITEAEELVKFPVPFIVSVFDMEFNKLNDETEATFIEYNGEYFSQKYMIYMAIREERLTRNTGDSTGDIVDHSWNMKE